MTLSVPFVGRKNQSVQLRRLYGQRRHVLIVGPAGVGKTTLIGELRGTLPFLVCARSDTLGSICGNLETALNAPAPHLPLVHRKNRLLEMLAERGPTVVFDGVGWVTPKVSSFFEHVMEFAPVWICARSELAPDIGHFWPLLARFERVELPPFHLSESRALLAVVVESGRIPASAMGFAPRLHQLAGGLPRLLRELLEQLAAGHYDLSHRAGLRLLELDCRIKVLPPLVA